MVKLVNKAKMDTATTGTGTITLGAADPAFQSFAAAGVSDGDTIRYGIEENNNWEIGTGVYTAAGTTLTRSVTESSNAGSPIDLQGNAVVYVTAAVGDFLEPDNNLSDVDDAPTALGNLGLTATAAELNTLDGITATTTEINYLSGATGNIQNQLDSISVTAGSLTKSFLSGEVSSISLSSALSPAPVVSVTKEVPQVGVVSKGSWDVATSGVNYDRLDSAYDTTLGFVDQGWDISTASFLQSFSVSAKQNSTETVFFKPDGTKMYISGSAQDNVDEYDLSTAWDVTTASFVQSFDVSAKEIDTSSIFFKSDGTELYIMGYGSDSVHQYSLSTAWDVSTAVFLQSFSVNAQETLPMGLFFKPDGTKMYVIGHTGDDVNEYNLSTAWDVSTASYVQRFIVGGQEISPNGLFFKPDGTKMYVIGSSGDDVNEYNLSTAWDVSTASFVQSFSVSAQDTNPKAVFFKPDGLKMYVIGDSGDDVNEYDLDVSGTILALGSGSFASTDVGKTIEGNGGIAVLTSTSGSYSEVTAFTDSSTIAAGDWAMYGAVFDVDKGIKLSSVVVNGWDISTASYVQNFSVGSQDTDPYGLFFKTDGTKMYVLGGAGDDVNEYNLSSAWDVSTASYSKSFSVLAQESIPMEVFFKPDGTKMYIIGLDGVDVNEYNLTTAWDISTASFLQLFSVSAQETQPRSIFFKPDGTKMYVVGTVGDKVYEYDLSTAWDVSTASFLQDFSVSAQENAPLGLYFKLDGSKMYVIGSTGDDVNEYNLSTAWDISTASYSQNYSVSVITGETTPHSLFFKPDGSKMYVVGTTTDRVFEYNIGSFVALTNQYTPAITNTGGQINSAFWLDINGMTTDEAAGDGNVYYAVSTDNRTTWSVIKDADGVRPIVRNNAGTWEYNSTEILNGFDITTASDTGKTFFTGSQDNYPQGITIADNGTRLYVAGYQFDSVYQYGLSTAYDISTASYVRQISTASFDTSPQNVTFSPDGTRMYLVGDAGNGIDQYSLSTPWEINTVSYVRFFSTTETNPTDVFFKPDGTKMYVIGTLNDRVYQYTLSTPWEINTASLDTGQFIVSGQENNPYFIHITPDGTKMFIFGQNQNGRLFEYNLGTAWDSRTAVYNGVNYATNTSTAESASFSTDGIYFYALNRGTQTISQYATFSYGYTTATTWVPATTNTELAALQEALTESGTNRMDKTQLEAVTDPNHYTLGDTLDLMIGLYLGSSSASLPYSDGVSIDYDAESLNKGAILGTDYDYDFPDSTTVRITSNATQNLKIRVV